MSFLNIVRLAAIGLSILVLVAGGALLLLDQEKLQAIFGGGGELPRLDFAALEREAESESYLICPSEACSRANPDDTAPTFSVPVERLRAGLIEYVEASPGVRSYRLDPERNQFVFLVPAPDKATPDVVTVRLYPAGDGGSSLAIYSRSEVGRSNRSVHRARVKRWLAALSPAE